MSKNDRSTLKLHNKLPVIGLSLFSLVSWFMTFRGLAAFMGDAGWDTFAIALIFSLAVQIALAGLAIYLYRANGLFTRLGVIGLIFLLWNFSVVFAFSYWWTMLRGTDYSIERFTVQVEELAYPIRHFGASYQIMAGDLSELSRYSTARANEEDTKGGTCGDRSRPGPGPRQNLRREDAALFGDLSKHFANRAKESSRLVATLDNAIKEFDQTNREAIQQTVREAQARARILRDDPRIAELKTTLRGQLNKHSQGVKNAFGKLVRCPDTRLESIGRRVSARLNLPEIPKESIIIFEPSKKAGLVKTYEELVQLVRWSTGLSDQPPTFGAKDIIALAFAAITDLMILFLGRIVSGSGTPRGPRGLRSPPIPEFESDPEGEIALQAIEQEMQAEDRPAAAILRKFLVRTGRRSTSYIVPENPPEHMTDAIEARRLAEMLESDGAIRLSDCNFPVRKLRKWVRDAFGAKLDGIRTVSIFSVHPLQAVTFNLAGLVYTPEATADADKSDE